jgi:hypothetical protein
MKTITTTAALRGADSSLDATLDPVAIRCGDIVSRAGAFPPQREGTPKRPTQGKYRMLDSTLPSVTAKRTR